MHTICLHSEGFLYEDLNFTISFIIITLLMCSLNFVDGAVGGVSFLCDIHLLLIYSVIFDFDVLCEVFGYPCYSGKC